MRIFLAFLFVIIICEASFSQNNLFELNEKNWDLTNSNLVEHLERNAIIGTAYLKNTVFSDDPYLKGTVEIKMEWINGKLSNADVKSNNTGSPNFGTALIDAMQNWYIKELPIKWNSMVPFKTEIYGSKNPAFKDCCIFTGKVIQLNGLPVKKARIILNPVLNGEAKADTLYTNREGIFIKTLLKPGKWEVICQNPVVELAEEFQINISVGEHIKKTIKLDK